MNILLFGDVVGRPGRMALQRAVPVLRQQHHIDLVVANVENLAHGFGITPETIQELRDAGVDVFTSGNHIWKNAAGSAMLQHDPADVVRPANYMDPMPGRGWTEVDVRGTRVVVINLLGNVFMPDPVDSPFQVFDRFWYDHGEDAVVIVDLHAEATGEKRTFGWWVDGRAAVVVGTHTHVQTSDEQILAKGTAYITDLGMSGAVDSSLGMDKELVIQKVAKGMNISLEPPVNPHEVVASGVVVSIDASTRRATHIERVDWRTQV